jgi:hypothetical protein
VKRQLPSHDRKGVVKYLGQQRKGRSRRGTNRASGRAVVGNLVRVKAKFFERSVTKSRNPRSSLFISGPKPYVPS